MVSLANNQICFTCVHYVERKEKIGIHLLLEVSGLFSLCEGNLYQALKFCWLFLSTYYGVFESEQFLLFFITSDAESEKDFQKLCSVQYYELMYIEYWNVLCTILIKLNLCKSRPVFRVWRSKSAAFAFSVIDECHPFGTYLTSIASNSLLDCPMNDESV